LLRAFLLDLFFKKIDLKKKQLLSLSFIILLTCFWFTSCYNIKSKKPEVNIEIDSISTWIQSSRNSSFSLKEKKSFLLKSYNLLKNKPKDTLTVRELSTVAYRFYEINDTVQFLKINREVIELAKILKDTFTIADAHWSYADYYHFREVYTKSYYHYNISYNHFNNINKEYQAARILYQMAIVKGRYRDYTGSEILNFQAIKIFEKLNDSKFLYFLYDHLALLQIDIKEYDKALFYLDKALFYLNKVDKKEKYYSAIYNNIGFTYLEKGEYNKAIEYFNRSLKYNNDIRYVAMAIDNRAYTRLLLNDTTNVKEDLFKALQIKDSLNNKTGTINSKINISEYYKYKKEISKAVKYAKEANTLAKEVKNGLYYLKSLEQLSNLEPKKAKIYLEEYIKYNDSLIENERKTLDKFTRIEFETDEVIEQNEKLTQQQVWILFVSSAVILVLIFVYFLKVQKAKNEKLVLETEQQKANEQVYLLTLKQQATLEEERTRERNRISQELHDGILGRLFGTRVGMGFLDINADEETKKQHESFLEELQDIEKEIREVSHKLNTNFDSADVNFTNIINQLLESKSQIGDFQFQLNIDSNISWKSTDEIIKVNVYRIIQEALQNTIKHAKANHVSIEFFTDKSYLNILLKDDGVGFNLKKSKKGIGLKNIQSRVQNMKGTLDIKSAMNEGTLIHIKIPIEQP